MLNIWKNHFNQPLNGEEAHDSVNEQPRQVYLVDDLELNPPDLSKIEVAIARQKSNKTAGDDGLQAKLTLEQI